MVVIERFAAVVVEFLLAIEFFLLAVARFFFPIALFLFAIAAFLFFFLLFLPRFVGLLLCFGRLGASVLRLQMRGASGGRRRQKKPPPRTPWAGRGRHPNLGKKVPCGHCSVHSL